MLQFNISRWLPALGRYLFVKAPSRQESQVQVARAGAKIKVAVSRLDRELKSLEGSMREQAKESGEAR
jgi:hypothetical protein